MSKMSDLDASRQYETDALPPDVITVFTLWFDNEIGTDIEYNDLGNGKGYLICFDLTTNDIEKCKAKEQELITLNNRLNSNDDT
jgi:hypothetical protein